MSANKELNYVV